MSRYIHARIYSGKDDDLIEWLESLEIGERSQAIRNALRVGIGLMPPPETDSARMAEIMQKAIEEVFTKLNDRGRLSDTSVDVNRLEEAFGDKLDDMLGGFG